MTANGPATRETMDQTAHYTIREAVGVFSEENALVSAIDELEVAGFDRADISVLGPGTESLKAIKERYASVKNLEDDGNVPREAFVDPDSRTELNAAAVGFPVYVGAIGGLFAVVASGGTLAFAIPAAIAGGLVGGGAGGLAARAIGREHRDTIARQMREGGLLLWVRTDTPEKEQRAFDLLKEAGGTDVHVHETVVERDSKDIPVANVQADPFLEPGPDEH